MTDKLIIPNPDGTFDIVSTFTAWQEKRMSLLEVQKPKVHRENSSMRKKRKKSIKIDV